MASRSRLRASDADRERVAERLRQAAAEGRLLAEEFEQRLGSALRARTYGELDAVVADLPIVRRASRPVLRPALAIAIALATVVVVAVAALVITGLLTAWGLFALVAWWAFGGRYRHRRMLCGRRPWQVTRVGSHADRRAWL